jgi:tetratricopeptide (TPR) repeat protein
MVAAGTQSAFEDTSSYKGYFTNSVLANLSRLRDKDSNCSMLAVAVEKDLQEQGLPSPESYLIGSFSGWPLPNAKTESVDIRVDADSSLTVLRRQSLARIQDAIVGSQTKPVWFWGQSGMGKTVIARQLREQNPYCIYTSIPKASVEFETVVARIAIDTADQLVELFPSGQVLPGDLSFTFEKVSEELPGSLLIVDHMDRLDRNSATKLVSMLSLLKFDTVFISRHPPETNWPVAEVLCQPLSPHEMDLFCERFGEATSEELPLIKVASKGVPIKLRQMLSAGINTPSDLAKHAQNPDLLRALAAVATSGGFVDEDLFCGIFDLTCTVLAQLEDYGLISFAGDSYAPHDSLFALSAGIQDQFEKRRVIDYWGQQVLSTPHNLTACRSLVNSIVATDDLPEEIDVALAIAVESLSRIKDWGALQALGVKLVTLSSPLISTLLELGEQLVRVTKYDTVDLITGRLQGLDLKEADLLRLWLIQSERDFWFGDFEKSTVIGRKVVDQAPNTRFSANAHINIGISHFFKGEWKEAIGHFIVADNTDAADPRTVGWARLMMGSIWGILGVDILEGRRLLQSSARLLGQVNDVPGTASAWNNWGEMSWKIGEYRTALIQLTRSYDLAVVVDDKSTLLESTRNLVHVRLRLDGPHSQELREVVSRAIRLLKEVPDPTEQMQVWNTLATVSAYQGDIVELGQQINQARIYTEGNKEYYLYTLANASLLAALQGNTQEALDLFSQAYALAYQGYNYLAVKQIAGDAFAVAQITGTDSCKILSAHAQSLLVESSNQEQTHYQELLHEAEVEGRSRRFEEPLMKQTAQE